MNSQLFEKKQILRRQVQEKLENMSDAVRHQQIELLSQRLRDFMSDKMGIWAYYKPLRLEAQVSESSCLSQLSHRKWVWPLVDEGGMALEFFQVPPHLQIAWKKNRLGVLEPQFSHQQKSECKVEISDLSGVLVPGLMFDRYGGRLGRGKAFYDRALQDYEGIKVGLLWREQLSRDLLDLEAHDIRMNFLVCPDEIINCPS